MIVLDTSALLDFLIGRPQKPQLLSRLTEDADLHAPHLIDVEVLHALRHLVRSGVVSHERAVEARADAASLSITRYPLGAMADRVWALRDNLTQYDAASLRSQKHSPRRSSPATTGWLGPPGADGQRRWGCPDV